MSDITSRILRPDEYDFVIREHRKAYEATQVTPQQMAMWYASGHEKPAHPANKEFGRILEHEGRPVGMIVAAPIRMSSWYALVSNGKPLHTFEGEDIFGPNNTQLALHIYHIQRFDAFSGKRFYKHALDELSSVIHELPAGITLEAFSGRPMNPETIWLFKHKYHFAEQECPAQDIWKKNGSTKVTSRTSTREYISNKKELEAEGYHHVAHAVTLGTVKDDGSELWDVL